MGEILWTGALHGLAWSWQSQQPEGLHACPSERPPRWWLPKPITRRMLAPASRQTDVLAGVSLSHRNRPIWSTSTTPQHPDKSAKSILQPSEHTGRVFNCSKHRNEIDNSMCCFSPREGGHGLLVKASLGCPAASQRLHPPALAAFPSAEPSRAVLRLSGSYRVALSHVLVPRGAADLSPQPRLLLETPLLDAVASALWRHLLPGTIGGFVEGLSAVPGGLELLGRFVWRPPRCLCWVKVGLLQSPSSAFPCPSIVAGFGKPAAIHLSSTMVSVLNQTDVERVLRATSG